MHHKSIVVLVVHLATCICACDSGADAGSTAGNRPAAAAEGKAQGAVSPAGAPPNVSKDRKADGTEGICFRFPPDKVAAQLGMAELPKGDNRGSQVKGAWSACAYGKLNTSPPMLQAYAMSSGMWQRYVETAKSGSGAADLEGLGTQAYYTPAKPDSKYYNVTAYAEGWYVNLAATAPLDTVKSTVQWVFDGLGPLKAAQAAKRLAP